MKIEAHGYLIILLGVLILILAFIFSFLANTSYKEKTTSPQNILEECNIFQYNGEAKINIVFFATQDIVKRYVDFFLSSTPFNEKEKGFNFFYIDDFQPTCKLYKGIAVLCYSKELIEKASSCPNDFLVVLSSNNERIRSSAYQNVMSLNINHVLTVFLHEFGHVFANFAEEYVPAKLPLGQPNCKGKCSDFIGEIDSCFQGCSEEQFHRSVNEGVMRTLSPPDKENPYGIFNSNILRELILENAEIRFNAKITGKAALDTEIDCSREKYILSELSHDGTIINTVKTGCIGSNGNGPYKYAVFSINGQQILEGDFNAYLFTAVSKQGSDGELEGEVFSFEEAGKIYLKIPIIEGADKLEIKDPEDNIIGTSNILGIGARPCLIE